MHLHNHSSFSVIDGRSTIQQYVDLAAADGQSCLAITDHGVMGGSIELYKAAKEKDIKPIIGMEMYVDVWELNETQFPSHLTILAKNEDGYRALISTNNLAHRQFYYRPRVTLKQLVDGGFTKDWFILSGCLSSPTANIDMSDVENMLTVLNQKSAGVFLEIMWHESSNEEFNAKQMMHMERISSLYHKLNLPLVVTNDCHFGTWYQEKIQQDFLHQTHSEVERELDGRGFYLKTKAEMEKLVHDYLWDAPYALAHAEEIGEACNIVIPEADHTEWYVPDITGGTPKAKIIKLCEAALKDFGYPKEYWDRYEYELGVLSTSDAILNSYLVTDDVVSWCRENNIPIAGRGSMAGSLISFLLGITKEDPIKYNLSFSRAVNPARPTIPDFDLDVSSLHRDDILNYLKERYTGNIPIAAYTHYGPKGALRKILGMEHVREMPDINRLCASLPDDWPALYRMEWNGEHYDLNEAAKAASPDEEVVEIFANTKKSIRTKPEWLKDIPEQYIDTLCTYEGVYSTMSSHPSGVLISGPERELEREVPLQYIASSKIRASAYDMYTLKKLGLFKLDVLGLRTMDQLHFMETVSGAKLPDDNYDDPTVLMAFGNKMHEGFLTEIFQMSGGACKGVIHDINGINTFEDIIAANTLARPGCAQFTRYYRSGYEGLIDEYPIVKEVLGPTNGLILFQEQVMEIGRVMADFDDAEQDDIKESIKYFRRDHWDKTIVPLFSERCAAKGIDATHMLEAIARMASYTYNRAHAMTYAAIAYKMMWYKVYHPAVFYAAVFDGSDDKDKLVLESQFFGVIWNMPDINRSEANTTIVDGEILLGLGAIKGVGPAALEAINEARPFVSFEDMRDKINKRKCNARVLNALQAANALTGLGLQGTPVAFQEAFGFSHLYLNRELCQELYVWQEGSPVERLSGFAVGVRASDIKAVGRNHGKEMCHLSIINNKGINKAVIFSDVWRNIRGDIYSGAPLKLYGQHQVNGDFIVSGIHSS